MLVVWVEVGVKLSIRWRRSAVTVGLPVGLSLGCLLR